MEVRLLWVSWNMKWYLSIRLSEFDYNLNLFLTLSLSDSLPVLVRWVLWDKLHSYNPSWSFSLIPFSLSLSILIGPDAYAMLLPLSPWADVHVTIRPLEITFTIFFPIFKFTFVSSAITPNFSAPTFHVAISEFSLIYLIKVSKVVFSKTFELALHEISLIVATIFPIKSSLALFFTFVEITSISSRTIVPSFYTFAVLLIFIPLAFKSGVLSVDKYSKAVRLIVHPLPFVDIPISMSHSSFAMSLASFPHSFVLWTIWPKHDSESISLPSLFVYLAFVKFAFLSFLKHIDVYSINARL